MGISAVSKSFMVLDYIAAHPGCRVTDVAEAFGYPFSTAHRLVGELLAADLVQRDASGRALSLGSRFLRYVGLASVRNAVRILAAPIMDRIARITGETVHLAQMVQDELIYIDKRESAHAIRMYSSIGSKVPYHCTAVGKATLAFMNADSADRILRSMELTKYTAGTIVETTRLREELASIRNSGYSIDNEEQESGIICLACPVFDGDSNAIGALSLSCITSRMSLSRLLTFRNLVAGGVEELNRNIRSDGSGKGEVLE